MKSKSFNHEEREERNEEQEKTLRPLRLCGESFRHHYD